MHYLTSLLIHAVVGSVVGYCVAGLVAAVVLVTIAAARAVAAVLPALLLIGAATIAALTLTPGQVAFAIAMFLLCSILALWCAVPGIDSFRNWRTRALAESAVARALIAPPVPVAPPVLIAPPVKLPPIRRSRRSSGRSRSSLRELSRRGWVTEPIQT
jgi:hypothetical protein